MALSYILTPLFSNVSRAYSNHEAIVLPIDGCDTNSTCEFSLPAPGFDISCSDDVVPYNFGDLASAGFGDQTVNPSTTSFPNNQATSFAVNISFGGPEDFAYYSAMDTTILYTSNAACAGQVQKRHCTLRLGIVQYPVTVRNSVATMGSWQIGPNDTIRLTQPSDSSSSFMLGYDLLFTGSYGAGD